MAKPRVVIVGFGSIGRRHAENLRRLGVDQILIFRKKKRRLPGWESTDRWNDVVAFRPTIACITNPTSLHVSYAQRLANIGCDLFIEKPLSSGLRGLAKLRRVVSKKKLITMVGCNQRFHPQLLRIQSLIKRGAIGQILSARLSVGQYLPDWHPKEDYRKGYAAQRHLGGGVILTLIHEIDLANWIFGPLKRAGGVVVNTHTLRIQVEDLAELLFQNIHGTPISIHLDYLQRTLSRRYEIIGENGTITWDYSAGELRIFTPGRRGWQVERMKSYNRNDMYVSELKHFLTCVRTRRSAWNNLDEATATLIAALTAKRAGSRKNLLSFIP